MRNFYLLAVLFICSGLFARSAVASSVLELDIQEQQVGKTLYVALEMDTQAQSINAIESNVSFSHELLEFKASDEYESAIGLWIKKPVQDGLGVITFSGMTPGGFVSEKAGVTTLNFTVKQSGKAIIMLVDPQMLLNDGFGTEANVTSSTLSLAVLEDRAGEQTNATDTELPERFVPSIVIDPDLFSGRATLVFSTHDAGSGLSHFEVKEGTLGQYVRTDSPYKIKNQNLDSIFYIKAVDNAGNERIEVLYPPNWNPWYEPPGIITMLVGVSFILILLAGWYVRRLRS